mmetsp:Transcript_108610/g.315889  ORF Transcript_108610/g.315889 Transcript_108610/m.315889 type:complete len:883 (-) Transcript_108610:120-2768(-)
MSGTDAPKSQVAGPSEPNTSSPSPDGLVNGSSGTTTTVTSDGTNDDRLSPRQVGVEVGSSPRQAGTAEDSFGGNVNGQPSSTSSPSATTSATSSPSSSRMPGSTSVARLNGYPARPASQRTTEVLMSQVNQFMEDRKTAKTARYTFVLYTGSAVISAGFLGFVAGGLIRNFTSFFIAGWTLSLISHFLAMVGCLIISTCPLDEFDVDAAMSELPLARSVFWLSLLMLTVSETLVYFPYVIGIISTLLLLCGLLGGTLVYIDHHLRATTLLTCWVVADVLSLASIDLAKFATPDTANEEKHGLLERALLNLAGGLLLGCVLFKQRYTERIASKSVGRVVGGDRGKALRLAKQKRMDFKPAADLNMEQSGNMLRQTHTVRKFTVPKVGWNATLAVYFAIYGRFLVVSVSGMVYAIELYAHRRPDRLGQLMESIIYMIPPATIFLVGRENIFNLSAYYFDQNNSHSDGAFVGELLTQSSISVGDAYWVHKKVPDPNIDLSDVKNPSELHKLLTLKNWDAGVLTMIDEETNIGTVMLSGGDGVGRKGSAVNTGRNGSIVPVMSQSSVAGVAAAALSAARTRARRSSLTTSDISAAAARWKKARTNTKRMVEVKLPQSRHMHADKLLEVATKHLRCISWDNMSFELMSSSAGGADTFNLSRPVKSGEQIDFFMSHSWHDNAEKKWVALQHHVAQFKKAHGGRSPTFWLDKVCIDQDNISDGLKALPVNVMACKKMLVLLGDTYHHRLWCVWELFTLFSFQSERKVHAKIEIADLNDFNKNRSKAVEIEAGGAKNISSKKNLVNKAKSGLEMLQTFELSSAHTYDPNEEKKILGVVRAVGEAKFEEAIHKLGRLHLERKQDIHKLRASFRAVGSRRNPALSTSRMASG